jgi:hypothetical protein
MIALLLLLAQDGTLVASDATQPKVAIGPDGTIHVVFIRGGNIAVASSTDGGKTFSEPVVAIDNNGEAKGGMQRGPRIGVDAKGAVVVTAPLNFDEAEKAKRFPTQELWIARSTDGGKTWTKPVQVNEVAKKAPESLHWMAVSPDGDAHVAWLDMRDGRPREQYLYYAKVGPDLKVGKNLRIAGPVCECCAPGLAVDDKGNPFVLVREGAKKNRAVVLTRSTNGGKSWSPPAAVNTGPTSIDT